MCGYYCTNSHTHCAQVWLCCLPPCMCSIAHMWRWIVDTVDIHMQIDTDRVIACFFLPTHLFWWWLKGDRLSSSSALCMPDGSLLLPSSRIWKGGAVEHGEGDNPFVLSERHHRLCQAQQTSRQSHDRPTNLTAPPHHKAKSSHHIKVAPERHRWWEIDAAPLLCHFCWCLHSASDTLHTRILLRKYPGGKGGKPELKDLNVGNLSAWYAEGTWQAV